MGDSPVVPLIDQAVAAEVDEVGGQLLGGVEVDAQPSAVNGVTIAVSTRPNGAPGIGVRPPGVGPTSGMTLRLLVTRAMPERGTRTHESATLSSRAPSCVRARRTDRGALAEHDGSRDRAWVLRLGHRVASVGAWTDGQEGEHHRALVPEVTTENDPGLRLGVAHDPEDLSLLVTHAVR